MFSLACITCNTLYCDIMSGTLCEKIWRGKVQGLNSQTVFFYFLHTLHLKLHVNVIRVQMFSTFLKTHWHWTKAGTLFIKCSCGCFQHPTCQFILNYASQLLGWRIHNWSPPISQNPFTAKMHQFHTQKPPIWQVFTIYFLKHSQEPILKKLLHELWFTNDVLTRC